MYNLCWTVGPFINEREDCVATEKEIGYKVQKLSMLISECSVAPDHYDSGSVSLDETSEKRTMTHNVQGSVEENPGGGCDIKMVCECNKARCILVMAGEVCYEPVDWH